jgi:hypothetical protein
MDMREKLDLLTQIPQEDSSNLSELGAGKVRDYVECLSIFLTTSNPILEESSFLNDNAPDFKRSV